MPLSTQKSSSLMSIDVFCCSWCEDDSVQRQLLTTGGSGAVATIKYPMRVNHLIDLPHDYIELINKVSTFTSVSAVSSGRHQICFSCNYPFPQVALIVTLTNSQQLTRVVTYASTLSTLTPHPLSTLMLHPLSTLMLHPLSTLMPHPLSTLMPHP